MAWWLPGGYEKCSHGNGWLTSSSRATATHVGKHFVLSTTGICYHKQYQCHWTIVILL